MRISRKAWLACGLAALAGVGWFGLVSPALRSIERLRLEEQDLRARVERADNGAATLARMRRDLAQASVEAEGVVVPIPADSDVATLVRRLSERLDKLGVREREITTGAAAAAEDLSSMPMSVRIQGPFLSVHEALRWIESLPRLVRVQRLRVDADKGQGAIPGFTRAELMFDAFYSPSEPQGSAAKPRGPVAGATTEASER